MYTTPAAKKIYVAICLCMIWNKGTLTKQKTCWKSYHSIRLLAPNRYKSDLSNEVLYILVGQEATKISNGKVGGGIPRNRFLNKHHKVQVLNTSLARYELNFLADVMLHRVHPSLEKKSTFNQRAVLRTDKFYTVIYFSTITQTLK